jgi:transcriptional regulator
MIFIKINQEEIKRFIQENSFGILINQMEENCVLLIYLLKTTKDGKHILQGHIAKENPQWKGFKEDDTV